MKIFTLFALVLSLGISNGFGKVYPGLKVKGDFRKIQLLVEDVGPNKLVTTQDIKTTVKLRLFSNNIKIQEYSSEYIYVDIGVMPLKDNVNSVYAIEVRLIKRSEPYEVSKSVAGYSFEPRQGSYAGLGILWSKGQLLSEVQGYIDAFLVDYIESNMED